MSPITFFFFISITTHRTSIHLHKIHPFLFLYCNTFLFLEANNFTQTGGFMFLIIVITSYVITALTEYLLHRYYLHKANGHPHVSEHHVLFHGRSTFENPSRLRRDILSSPGYIFFSWLPTGLLSILIYAIQPLYGLLFGLTGGFYLAWVESSHYLFHKPQALFIEKSRIYQQLKLHHKIHHIYYNTNYGIGSSLWDHILHTKSKRTN